MTMKKTIHCLGALSTRCLESIYRTQEKRTSWVCLIFVDFTKTCDLINHIFMVNKSLDLGMRAGLVFWLTDFLISDSWQVVSLSGVTSTFKPLNYKVLQGAKNPVSDPYQRHPKNIDSWDTCMGTSSIPGPVVTLGSHTLHEVKITTLLRVTKAWSHLEEPHWCCNYGLHLQSPPVEETKIPGPPRTSAKECLRILQSTMQEPTFCQYYVYDDINHIKRTNQVMFHVLPVVVQARQLMLCPPEHRVAEGHHHHHCGHHQPYLHTHGTHSPSHWSP